MDRVRVLFDKPRPLRRGDVVQIVGESKSRSSWRVRVPDSIICKCLIKNQEGVIWEYTEEPLTVNHPGTRGRPELLSSGAPAPPPPPPRNETVVARPRTSSVRKKASKASMQKMAREAAVASQGWGPAELIYLGQPTAVLRLLLDPSTRVYSSLANLVNSDWAKGRLVGVESCLSMAGMLTLAHHVLHQSNGRIYGGFVRDTVLHEERAADLDIGLRSKAELEPFLTALINWTRSEMDTMLGLSFVDSEWKGDHVLRATFQMLWGQHEGRFDVELVNVPHWEKKRPLVDSDVNNLRVSLNGIQHMRAGQGGPINQIIEHARLKRFMPIDPDRPLRVKAMLQKGWELAASSGAVEKPVSMPAGGLDNVGVEEATLGSTAEDHNHANLSTLAGYLQGGGGSTI